MSRETFETGNTVQFTFTSSIAPDSAPLLKITGIGTTTPINSLTAVASDSTHYYALYTMPTSAGVYMGEWHAEKTVVSSTYPFKKRFLFNIVEPKRSLT